MDTFKALVGFCLIVSLKCQEDPPGYMTTAPVKYPTKEINSGCNRTEEQEDLRQDLNEIKGHLKTIINALENGDYCHEPTSYPGDCYDIQESGETVSGVYTIKPEGMKPFEVYCDMDTDGGGWTVFQRRQDGSVEFFRTWNDYANGFGSLEGEHWLGNQKLHHLTNQKSYGIRVDLADFHGSTRFAKYNSFVVANSFDNYRLQIGPYSVGTAGDAMTYCDNQQFSTRDQDNDIYADSCALLYKGGWWYTSCHAANLNGLYLGGTHSSYADGIHWKQWRGYNYSLKFTEMKLRPV